MASITITVPDALVPRLTAAMRAAFPQHADLADGQAFKRVTSDYWRRMLADYETAQASRAASAQVDAQEQQSLTDAAGIG